MTLYLNGELRAFPDTSRPFTLAVLVDSLGLKADRIAVELNREIVQRGQWLQTLLKEGDRLEIVHFVGGGRNSLLISGVSAPSSR